MRIQLLDPVVVNQIAAGEVIERPASVIKELLENSLDAGAQTIFVEVSKAGRGLIRVRDDGRGIHREDLPLAIASHATSKIDQLADLHSVATLGFRGEALASIASISRFRLISKTAEQEIAWSLNVEGGQAPFAIQPDAHPTGTTLEVRDLFFNTPVRRKFLRSDLVEMGHIESILKRLVLSRYDLSFNFLVEDKIIWQLGVATEDRAREKRIAKILGSSFLTHAVKIDYQTTEFKLWGWIGLPSYQRSQADSQYLYINGRMIRDKLLTHAIRLGYEGMLHPGRHPAYVLYLEMAPEAFDVNVHPGKQEVRFHEPRMVHNFMLSALKQTLTQAPVVASVNSVNQEELLAPFAAGQKQYFSKVPIRTLQSIMAAKVAERQPDYVSAVTELKTLPLEKTSTINGDLISRYPMSSFVMLEDRYVMSMYPQGGWALYDLYAVIQHLEASRLLQELSVGTGITARAVAVPFSLHLPVAVEKTEAFAAGVSLGRLFQHYEVDLTLIGLGFNEVAPKSLAIRQLPSGLTYGDPKPSLEKIIEFLYRHYPQPMTSIEYQLIIGLLTEVSAPLNLLPVEIEKILVSISQEKNHFSNILQKPLYLRLHTALLTTLFSAAYE